MCRALVVEDDPRVGGLLATILQREQFEATVVRSAFEARALLSADHFHLIVLDLAAPDYGWMVIEYIRQHRLSLLKSIVVISANPALDRAALNGEYPEPVCKFVLEPIDVRELVDVVHACKAVCAAPDNG
ncbi:MAG TPA: response regulator [Thermoanaerobaculia bacterium]